MTTATAHPCLLCGNDLADQPVVCFGCQNRGERDLRDLPRLTGLLLDAARTPTVSAAEPVTGSPQRPLPLQVGIWSWVGLPSPGYVHARTLADALCQDGDPPLADQIHSWATAVAAELRDVTVPHVRRNQNADEAVARFVRFLLAQHDRACRLDLAGPYLDDIHQLWATARTLAKDWPYVDKLPAPCPHCWTTTLRRDNGASFVYCDQWHGGCGRRWPETDYARLVHILIVEATGATA